MANCIFCEGAGPMSGEDVISKWIGKELRRNNRPFQGYQAERGGGPGQPHIYTTNLLEIKSNVVCKRCNNEWMSALEEDVKPIIIRMLHGWPRRLTQRQQQIIAAWVIMKLMVAEYAYEGSTEFYFTQAERAAMMKERAIPDQTSVWLGFYYDDSDPTVDHDTAALIGHKHLRLSSSGVVASGYGAAFVVGRLVAHVICHRFPGHIAARLVLSIDRQFESIFLRVWPVNAQRVRWPRSDRWVVDTTSLEQLLDRWEATPIPITP
jgi:hypothetical protein